MLGWAPFRIFVANEGSKRDPLVTKSHDPGCEDCIPGKGCPTQKTMCPRLLGRSRIVSMVVSDSPNRWQVAYNHPIGNI